jgi:hypothetical protein
VKKLILLILFIILGLALILYGVGTVTAPVGNPIDMSPAGVPPAHTPTEPASVAPLIGKVEPDRDGLGYGKGESYVLQKNFSSFRWF